jgi:hypothetical protein
MKKIFNINSGNILGNTVVNSHTVQTQTKTFDGEVSFNAPTAGSWVA